MKLADLKSAKNLCAVFYLGTRKLELLIGDAHGELPRIMACEELINPKGFASGLVSNLQSALESIETLMDRFKGIDHWDSIPSYIVLGNGRLKTYRFSSALFFRGGRRTISTQEVKQVVEQTRNVATIPLSEHILQSVPESFLVDDIEGVRSPLDLEAERLGVSLQIFTMDFQGFKNIAKIFEVLELNIQGYFPKTLTLPEAVLSTDEKNQGAIVVDIADDVTQLILWKNGSLVGTRTIMQGGRHLTIKMAEAWAIDHHDAERVKEQFATLDAQIPFKGELIPLVSRNDRVQYSIHREDFQSKYFIEMKKWIAPIFLEIDTFLEEERLLYPHYVFTGGSVSTEGFLEWVHKEFARDGRLGITRKVEASYELLRDPAKVGALGMFKWLTGSGREYEPLFTPQGVFAKVFSSAQGWFAEYF